VFIDESTLQSGHCTSILTVLLLIIVLNAGCSTKSNPSLTFSSAPDNDLYLLFENFPRYDSPAEAILNAPPQSGVLLLADSYPNSRSEIADSLFTIARNKGLRMYVEYPDRIRGLEIGENRQVDWERGVVTTDRFGSSLARNRILMIHDGSFISVQSDNSLISMARVAGLDQAVYGMQNTSSWPVLFEHPTDDVLIATTGLSHFISGRFAPADAWIDIWKWILSWLDPKAASLQLAWEPVVRPTYRSSDVLPADAGRTALTTGVAWYRHARMLIDSTWSHRYQEAESFLDRVGPRPETELPVGDGSYGLLEGFSSRIHHDGSQDVRWWIRADCVSETAMAFALHQKVVGGDSGGEIAANLQDYAHKTSVLHQGLRADPASPEFGLVSWDVYHDRVYYGDDNARVILSTMATAGALGSDQWDEDILRAVLGNFRTTGPEGFRSNRLEGRDLEANGWEYYWTTPRTNFAPHYESWLWATYLWLYDKTAYAPLIERTKRGISEMMQAYPDDWHWTNGLQQERARMLLPLAWLIRVEDTALHREWLNQIATDLLTYQDVTGAIKEQLGSAGHGKYGPPKSNEEYGITEAPLIQENSDAIADMLYTSNFAFIGLHEAAAVTGDTTLTHAFEELRDFLIRIQVHAPAHPELDGAWFRAFDINRWEYWASNADLGWGAWAIETGWTQSWITSVLAMDELGVNLWALTDASDISSHFERYRQGMLPAVEN